MPVINPRHLLAQAERLLDAHTSSPVRQADRRRAISSAYYAAFHFILTEAADKFVGEKNRRIMRYALVYRSIDHGKLRGLCDEIIKHQPSKEYTKFIEPGSFSEDMKQFAQLVSDLHEKRQIADYDPSIWVKMEDARLAIVSAQEAIDLLGKAKLRQRKLFLTLLAFPPR